jgi:hypothetical protein
MAFTNTNYDESLYNDYLKRSEFVGQYYLNEPRFNHRAPYADNVRVGISSGPNTKEFDNRIHLESDLRGNTRPTSRQVINQHLPGQNMQRLYNHNTVEFRATDTRLDNPPCTLRGTGFNRWDWLPINPQKNVIPPFDYMVDSKRVAKDNHRACFNNQDRNINKLEGIETK